MRSSRPPQTAHEIAQEAAGILEFAAHGAPGVIGSEGIDTFEDLDCRAEAAVIEGRHGVVDPVEDAVAAQLPERIRRHCDKLGSEFVIRLRDELRPLVYEILMYPVQRGNLRYQLIDSGVALEHATGESLEVLPDPDTVQKVLCRFPAHSGAGLEHGSAEFVYRLQHVFVVGQGLGDSRIGCDRGDDAFAHELGRIDQ